MIRIGLVIPFFRRKGYEPKIGRRMPHKKCACNARAAVQSFFRKIISPHARNSSVLLQSTTVGLKFSIIIA